MKNISEHCAFPRQAGLMLASLGLALTTGLGGFARAADEPQDALLEQRLRAHIEFLADDLLAGRQPGTPGYDIAANYVASQFRQAGLTPAGEAGGWFQKVPLRRAFLVPDSATLALERDGTSQAFRWLEQFYVGPDLAHKASEVEAGMVFVGYGIDAPPLGHQDYSGLDLRGKVAVILAGQPASFPSEEGAHFASGREKTRAALAAGAVGVLTLYTPRTEKRFAWDRVYDRAGTPAMGWVGADGQVDSAPAALRGDVTLHYAAAGPLFEGSGHTIGELLALDEAGESLPHFALQGQVSMGQASRHELIESTNVVAALRGSDPLLADEYIVYTAHLDHIGELAGEGHSDAINNGALDNASGVAVMLETARDFAEGEAPRRSLLFVAVTAEEKGLVGSEFFARHPTVPAASLAGVINLDMPLLLYDFGDIIAFGAEHSSLGAAAGQAAEEAGIVLTPDPFPEQNIFVRSDHYRFVQQGVPSIFLVTGPSSRDGKTDTMPLFMGFLKEHYHKPSDDLNLPIDYRAAARFTRINSRIGEIAANQGERPSWHEGDFFGETFAP